MDRQDVKFSIRKKILGVTLVAALPFLAISIYLLISMSNYNHTYNKIVQNLTIANNYNLDFKEEMDESLYKMVVGYVTVDDFDDAEELKSPYVLIKNLRKEFRNLKKITTDTESKLWLDSLLRNIGVVNDGEIAYDDAPKAVFAHYRELEAMGLAAPQITYIMHALKEKGLDVDVTATTVEEAKENILAVLKKTAPEKLLRTDEKENKGGQEA